MAQDHLLTEPLRSTLNLDGISLTLDYSEESGYQVNSRFFWIARRLPLPLASAMLEAISLGHTSEIDKIVAGVRAEYRRLKFVRFNTPAAKEWAIINGGLNRAEGKRLKLTGRNNRKIEQWL